MSSLPRVLVLTQDVGLVDGLSELTADGYVLRSEQTLEGAYEEALAEDYDCLIADFRSTRSGGHLEDRMLESLGERCPEMSLIMVTSAETPETLERRAACTDAIHLRSPESASVVYQALTETLPQAAAPTQQKNATAVRPATDSTSTVTILGGITRQFETSTPAMKRMLAELEVAARHNVTILLIGETGSGKTFLSRLIHEVSPRSDKPFMHVACGALPSELIESELFGHKKGSFTSAHADKEGKFVAAGGGTILLDEIDVLGPEQQVKLLKVIETGEFEPVGSNQTLTSQARLVVASNLDLQPLVDQGRFRPDLYYRLNMLKFEVLPLRLRRPDIAPMAKKFIAQLAKRHDVRVDSTTPDFYRALETYPWPGNLRELENVIQRAVIYCSNGELAVDNLPSHILAG